MITLNDIAKKSGVSTMTVSRIINSNADADYQRPTFAKRAKRIRRIANEMGYRPNAMARAVSNGHFGNIGLIYSTDKGKTYLPESLERGIQDEIIRRRVNLIVSMIPEDTLFKEESLPKILTELMVNGLLIDYIQPPPEKIMKMISESKTPFLLINAGVDTNCVGPDDWQAGRDATRHLIGLGHRRISFVCLELNEDGWRNSILHHSLYSRYAGYQEAMSEAGLKPSLILGNRTLWDLAATRSGTPLELAPWLFGKKRPTAILFYSGKHGLPTIFRTIDLIGLRVPMDLSIVVFEAPSFTYGGFPMTNMALPFHEVGRAAVSALMDIVEGREETVKAIKIPFEMLPGMSCAPPSN